MGESVAFVRQQLERVREDARVADNLPQLREKRAFHGPESV